MNEFIHFNWMIFKALGLVSANVLLLVFLVGTFTVVIGNIFRGGDDD